VFYFCPGGGPAAAACAELGEGTAAADPTTSWSDSTTSMVSDDWDKPHAFGVQTHRIHGEKSFTDDGVGRCLEQFLTRFSRTFSVSQKPITI